MVFIIFVTALACSATVGSTLRLQSSLHAGDNIAGAIIFFSYIIAALFFTGWIIADILSISGTSQNLKQDDQMNNARVDVTNNQRIEATPEEIGTKKNHRKIFPVAASISFAVLSWNMLNFLITSYLEWWHMQGAPSADPISSISRFRSLFFSIWVWATNSSLFQTFAEDLLTSSRAWQTTYLALLYSYTWNLWMSNIGFETGLQHLWAYFILNQILPVSFTQNLFCTAIVLAVPKATQRRRSVGRFWQLRIAATLLYITFLFSIPATLRTVWFFPNLFALRVLLAAPFVIDFIDFNSLRNHDDSFTNTSRVVNRWCSLLLILLGLLSVFTDPSSLPRQRTETTKNFAVAALSDDMLIGISSAVIFMIMGPSEAV